ncbi:MAG: TonB-dependent receptor [uncultured Adhaeribacter sp.]|uniref:TonB-dependent receptor n=1 Tax=uncultured Adhaeribacter sp. TaxID=448109 RepID=A0A6J4JWN1_9BACT|nr:MAG: TonB-dependent receptor [uncultured Adhaeribacter sp.]
MFDKTPFWPRCLFVFWLGCALLLAAPKTRGQTAFPLSGTIVSGNSREPVAAASIVIKNSTKGAVTDEKGNFDLLLPGGTYQVTISALGFQTQTRQVYLKRPIRFTVYLLETSQQMQEVIISGRTPDQNVRDVQMGRIQLDLLQMRKIPVVLGESDIIKVLTLQPGVSTVGEGSGGFNVRGGRTDQNLVLLDEAPLFNTSHLLGFFTSVNTDAIQAVTLYKGNIPAAYGGRLSSLLAIRTKAGNPEKIKLTGGISPISARFQIDGPIIKDKLTFLVGARVAYPNWVMKSFRGETKQNRAFFYDINGKINYQLNPKNSISLTAYRSFDNFKFPEDTLYSWQSNAATLQWRHLVSDKLTFAVTALHSHYGFGTEGLREGYNFELNSTIQHQEIKADVLYTPGIRHKLELGASQISYQLQPGNLKPTGDNSSINALTIAHEFAREGGAYLSEEWALTPAFTLQAGLRYSWFRNIGPNRIFGYQPTVPRSTETIVDTLSFKKGESIKNYGGWEPRLALRVGLGNNTSVKASYNRTRQYLHLISNTTAISPVDFWKVSDAYVPPQIADQWAVGIFQNFKNNAWETSVEGFYKNLGDLVEYKNGATLLLNPALETDLLKAKGKAYGIEGSLHKNTGRLTGQISYTYSRTFTAVQTSFAAEQVNNGEYYPSHFDRPHNLAVSTLWDLKKGWTLAGNFVYITGRPATYPDGNYIFNNTTVVDYSRRNADRIPDYHRLDASLTKDTRKSKDQEKYSLWVVSLYNVYARKNPYSIFFTRYFDRTKAYRLSVFGTIIPSVTWNFNF